jgi:hypothetical protein
MRLFSLFVLLLAATPGWAVDYGKVPRTIVRQPAYRSKSPEYGLLLFGPRAKVRVWVVCDGETVYLDRNGDGDLTGKGERFAKASDCKNIEIADPDGKTRYVITAVGVHKFGKEPRHLMVNVDVKGPVAYQQYCDLELRSSPKKAALAHFHGPLTAGPRTINWKLPPQIHLTPGDKPKELFALIGTLDARHGCWVVVRTHAGDKCLFGKGIRPAVEVEFAPKAPGGKRVKKRYELDKFC